MDHDKYIHAPDYVSKNQQAYYFDNMLYRRVDSSFKQLTLQNGRLYAYYGFWEKELKPLNDEVQEAYRQWLIKSLETAILNSDSI
jgi:hypothetical protein